MMSAGPTGRIKLRGIRRSGLSLRGWAAVLTAVALIVPSVALATSAKAESIAGPTRYEQTDRRIAYQGTWVTFKTSGASGGTYKYSNSPATALVWFNGTQLDLIATKGYTQGKARVSLDGGTPVIVDLYNRTTLRQQKVYSTGPLSSGLHKVSVSFTGQKSVSGGGTRVNVDAVNVVGTLAQASTSTVVAPTTTTTTAVPANSPTASATGKVYYVDATGGNDSNSGTSTATPWKTLAKVMSAARNLKPGDQILLKRGEIWRERLIIDNVANGTASAPIVFGAYGSGDKPVISAGVNLGGTSQWTESSANIWKTGTIASASHDIGMVNWGPGLYGNKLSARPTSSSKQGDWYFDRSAHVLTMYSVGNPAAVYGRTLEAAQKYDAGYSVQNYISGAHSYLTFQNLAFKNDGYHAFTFGNGCNGIVVDACDFANVGGGEDGNISDGYGIELWAGATNITITHCTFTDIYNMGVSIQDDGSGAYTWSNISVTDNTFTRCGGGALEIWLHSSGAHTAKNLVFSGNTGSDFGNRSFRIDGYAYVETLTGNANFQFVNCSNVNNTWSNVKDSRYIWVASSSFLPGWTFDHNAYYPVGSTFVYLGGLKSFAYWQSQGMDTHSVTTAS
jgi:hypothetical protein